MQIQQIFRNNSEFSSEFLCIQPRWNLECRLNILNIILPLDCANITCMNHITDFSQFPLRDETLAIPFKLLIYSNQREDFIEIKIDHLRSG